MKLLSGPVSMFGAKTQIAALEKGLDVHVEMVPFSLSTLYDPKPADVLRVNPKAQVPVLFDGDLEIFDSTQIFEYFEDIKPEPALWPADKRERARARLLELKSDEVFFPNVTTLMPRARQAAGDTGVARALAAIGSYYHEMDNILDEHDYLAGDFSYADIAFYMAQFFASFLGAPIPADFARLSAWRSRMGARESVASVAGAMARYLGEQGVRVPEP